MTNEDNTRSTFCEGLNLVKKIRIAPDELDPAHYLGGDLGIDSIEMLEIWFHAERKLGIRLPDSAKRDVYTVAQVLAVLDAHAVAARDDAARVDHV